MPAKLGVNIDHVATLRQARRGVDPDPVQAARACWEAGADMIVCHLRADRRHIQDEDVVRLRKQSKLPLHLELAATPAMVKAALKVKPDSVCLVPERASEVTTEGGLKLVGASSGPIRTAIAALKKGGVQVSLFVDPDADAVRAAKKLGADAVELCTTRYAEAKGGRVKEELEALELATYLAREMGLEVHAGHGLDYHNARAVAEIAGIGTLNIGFSIVSRALFAGLKSAVAEMRKSIRG